MWKTMENLFQVEKKRSRVEFALYTEQTHGFNYNNNDIEDERVSGTTGNASGALEATGNGKKIVFETGSSHISALE